MRLQPGQTANNTRGPLGKALQFSVRKAAGLARRSLGPAATALFAIAWLTCSHAAGEPKKDAFDRGGNALWLRRHWMHEHSTTGEIAALAESLRARGIRRIYPFLGPMDRDGWPGWRSKAGLVRYVPERAGAFLAEIHRMAPEIKVIPWTGGVLDSDVHLQDESQRRAFTEHARQLIALGADGIHINVEPLPSGTPGYLDLLREVRTAIGPHTLSIAAYPPPMAKKPDGDGYWELAFLRKTCKSANELAVMAYDTGLTSAARYEDLVAAWTRQLASALPPPSAGGCEWLMGVPAYDDATEYHHPDVETIEHSLTGLLAGLRRVGRPPNFSGVAIYASFSADERKWAAYDRLWRGVEPVTSPPPDPPNKTE